MTPEETTTPEAATDTTLPSNDTSTTAADTHTTQHANKRNLTIGIGVTVLALILGYAFLFTDVLPTKNPFESNAAARVNGVTIATEEYEHSLENVTQTLQLQGIDTTDETIQEQMKSEALNRVINTQLLLQAATAGGYTADEAAINEQFSLLEEQFGGADGLAEQLTTLEIDETMLREDIAEQIIVTQYLEGETTIEEITVTDEEVQEFYNSLVAQAGDNTESLPALEDVRPQIETELISQKQQQMLADILANLRAQADVEILI